MGEGRWLMEKEIPQPISLDHHLLIVSKSNPAIRKSSFLSFIRAQNFWHLLCNSEFRCHFHLSNWKSMDWQCDGLPTLKPFVDL